MSLAVILPAHDEEGWIGACLEAVITSEGPLPHDREIILVANACTDATADAARSHVEPAAAQGWRVSVIETATPGKLAALNRAEDATTARRRVYLDADVVVSPPLLASLCAVLDCDAPRYASGTAVLPKAESRVSRAYGRFWQTLPFVTEDVPGFGIFAVNAAGRSRWESFPDIIADDMFVRLHFSPAERRKVPQTYTWPLVEGFARLVRVRRRQNAGVAQIADRFPKLLENEPVGRPGAGVIAGRALRDPFGFCAYAGVALAVKTPLFAAKTRWDRGR